MKTLRTLLLLIGIFLMCSSLAIAATIDLNDFYADPTVNVSCDDFSATLEEDPSWITVFLSNDPYIGDPLLPFPSEPFILSFDYEFTVASNNHDEFYSKVV